MSNCIFCKIAAKEIPAVIVWEDENYLAFLDIHPIKQGHTLVIPKVHYPYVFEIEDDDYRELWMSAKKVAGMLKKAFNPKTGKIGSIVYGLDVDHSHIHLVPIDKSGDLSFSNATNATPEQLKTSLQKIQANETS